jgi:hypothetical protein
MTDPLKMRDIAEVYQHPYTPHSFNEMHNTLSCHQMGGLTAQDKSVRPVDMGRFQARHLLEAGYVVVWDAHRARQLLESAREFGEITDSDD